MSHPPRPSGTNRACEGCKKKKTKCDGRRPKCSLCARIGSHCVYPPRKVREPAAHHRSVTGADRTIPGSSNQTAFAHAGPLVDDFSVGDDSQLSIQQQRTPNTYVSDSVGQNLQHLNDLTRQDYSPNNPIGHEPTSATTINTDPGNLDIFTYLASDFPDFMTQDLDVGGFLDFFPLTLDEVTAVTAPPRGTAVSAAPLPTSSTNVGVGTTTTSRLPSSTTGGADGSIGPQQRAEANSAMPRKYSMEVPPDIVGDMIELYFRRVQTILPLFSGPQFLQTYIGNLWESLYRNIDGETYFLLNAICALACRYSTGAFFGGTAPEDRGNVFASRARDCFHDSTSRSDFELSLRWLQGSILMAYYNQSCHPEWGLDGMVETCVCYAHGLQLNTVDKDPAVPSPLDSESRQVDTTEDAWSHQEERRRAWWSVWELDAFSAVAFRRPFLIDASQSHVRLPVSDEAWFSKKPVDSPVFNADPILCWKCLRDSPSREPRAWFLISNFVMVQIHQLGQSPKVMKRQIDDWENILACFSVLVHDVFEVELQNLLFDEERYPRSNWLILSQLMIHM
ncbi:hypothetical protein LTR72_008060 [Exophiala xenobiotica]|nr:hypothetical protein LTR72_008060 [Exophiala xenobiotica]KAK5288102.1 hypothetical protein LTR14_008439 [Exophiala xenobiotica]KAK5321993.1 hypothetical protein LTR93_006231 [Exophiala xenobiotica]KAK5401954.1 hypothetical protein LTR06_010655 [Exophiala xenobiotica]KAK5477588.1 hypothetical protein LTR55_008180 [Exophiala xenobiotica]